MISSLNYLQDANVAAMSGAWGVRSGQVRTYATPRRVIYPSDARAAGRKWMRQVLSLEIGISISCPEFRKHLKLYHSRGGLMKVKNIGKKALRGTA